MSDSVTIPTTSVRTLDGTAEVPLVGLGTYALRGSEGVDSLRTALDLGYRLLDTATAYDNEREVGQALRDSGVPRDDVVVTTKLRPQDAGREDEVLAQSLDALGLDHLDLWLVHWPPDGAARPATWERFVQAQRSGTVRAIGVSNYSLEQIDELTQATGVTPAVNQVKWGPALLDVAFLDGLRDRGVVLEGYSPFKATDLGAAPLTAAAEAHGVTPEQVVLRWHVQHGFVAIPKSGNAERQARNLDVAGFDLTAEQIGAIDALGGA